MAKDWMEECAEARLVELTQPWEASMPHWPTHPPFAMARTKEHGDYVLEGGVSSAAELITLGTHVGTHIDGLGHFSCGGVLHGGLTMEEAGIDRVAPLVRRAVLFDMAEAGPLAEDAEIGVEELKARQTGGLSAGMVALVRTGWGAYWGEAKRFLNQQRQPGISLEAACWLAEQGVVAIGADNVALERIPSPRMAVHVELLVRRGVHILECLNLEELAREAQREFLFVAAPLKIRAATGAPLRAFALLK